jgi:hypothetical protein
MIKSFRGLLTDGEQDTIRLGTNTGLTGYKIKKLQVMPHKPYAGSDVSEHVVMVWKYKQDAVDGIVEFSDPTLLAAGIVNNVTGGLDSRYSVIPDDVIFDNETFNQDIFITHSAVVGTEPCNWYLELEQVKLSQNEAAVATLKDMRGSN